MPVPPPAAWAPGRTDAPEPDRMIHSATPMLISQAAAISQVFETSSSGPTNTIHGNCVNACVPAPRPSAYPRIIQARCRAMSRRRTAARPRRMARVMAVPTTIRMPARTSPSIAARGRNRVNHIPDSAAASPHGTSSRPAARCQPIRRRRRLGENWKAPRRQYTVTLTMWIATGTAPAATRSWSGMTCAPPASPTRRRLPASTGTRLSAISPVGMSQPDLAEVVMSRS